MDQPWLDCLVYLVFETRRGIRDELLANPLRERYACWDSKTEDVRSGHEGSGKCDAWPFQGGYGKRCDDITARQIHTYFPLLPSRYAHKRQETHPLPAEQTHRFYQSAQGVLLTKYWSIATILALRLAFADRKGQAKGVWPLHWSQLHLRTWVPPRVYHSWK